MTETIWSIATAALGIILVLYALRFTVRAMHRLTSTYDYGPCYYCSNDGCPECQPHDTALCECWQCVDPPESEFVVETLGLY